MFFFFFLRKWFAIFSVKLKFFDVTKFQMHRISDASDFFFSTLTVTQNSSRQVCFWPPTGANKSLFFLTLFSQQSGNGGAFILSKPNSAPCTILPRNIETYGLVHILLFASADRNKQVGRKSGRHMHQSDTWQKSICYHSLAGIQNCRCRHVLQHLKKIIIALTLHGLFGTNGRVLTFHCTNIFNWSFQSINSKPRITWQCQVWHARRRQWIALGQLSLRAPLTYFTSGTVWLFPDNLPPPATHTHPHTHAPAHTYMSLLSEMFRPE